MKTETEQMKTLQEEIEQEAEKYCQKYDSDYQDTAYDDFTAGATWMSQFQRQETTKSAESILNSVARKHGFRDWDDLFAMSEHPLVYEIEAVETALKQFQRQEAEGFGLIDMKKFGELLNHYKETNVLIALTDVLTTCIKHDSLIGVDLITTPTTPEI